MVIAHRSPQNLVVNFVEPRCYDTRINLRMKFRWSCFVTLRYAIKYSNNSV